MSVYCDYLLAITEVNVASKLALDEFEWQKERSSEPGRGQVADDISNTRCELMK